MISRARPFIRVLSKDLIKEIDNSRSNPERLQLILEEMRHRKKAARFLEPYIEQIRQLLEDVSINASPDTLDVHREPFEQESLTNILPEIHTSDRKDIDLQIEPIIEEERFSFKPSFLNRLLGGGIVEVFFSGRSILLQYKGQKHATDLASISDIDIREGFIFSDLNFQSNEESICFPKSLSKNKLNKFSENALQ